MNNPKTLQDSCAAVARRYGLVDARHALVKRGLFPKRLMDELFAACCVGVDVERAYELGHVECVEKASSSVDAYAVARACVLYGDYRMALKTRHLFPEGTLMFGPVLKFCRRNDNRYTFFDMRLNAEIRNTRREWLEYFESSRFGHFY